MAVSNVGSDRLRNTQGFLTKNVKEIFWDLKFLSEVTGCRKTQVSDHIPLYIETCLKRISMGPTFLFGLDRCPVYVG